MAELGSPGKTIEILKKYGFNFQKRFGQNFLIDGNILEKIIKVADITKDDLHITFFICRITDGTITLKEHQAAIWITKEELSNYTFCPADTQIVAMLKES